VIIGVVCNGAKDLRSYLMAARRRPLLALLALGLALTTAALDAQRPLAPFPPAPFPPAQRFDPIPQRLPPLHISGEIRIRLRDASLGPRTLLMTVPWFQSAPPAPSRSPDRIRRAVVMLTALAASAMVLLLVVGWLFLRRRQS
jgi:hypothetical protein